MVASSSSSSSSSSWYSTLGETGFRPLTIVVWSAISRLEPATCRPFSSSTTSFSSFSGFFFDPKSAPAIDASVVVALGKVKSVRPTALDCDARSRAVKLASARLPIRMAGPFSPVSIVALLPMEPPASGAAWITEEG